MAVVNATLCLLFKQAEQTIDVLTEAILEACKRTCFPYEEEAAKVLGDIEDILVPLLYAQLITSISVDFGLAEVLFVLRYDATPEDEDTVEIDVLDLVLAPPEACVITLTLRDPDKAAFLRCLDIEQCSRDHVRVVLAPVTEEAYEGEHVWPSS
jgi:hypothetical protein